MIRTTLTVLTEADLAEASNKLTVKRARMDLDQGMAPTSISEDDDSLIVVWDDATCTFGAGGLLAATCSCPSRNFCRHRVRTILHLASIDDSPQEPSAPPIFELAELRRAAGAALWHKACELLARGVEARVDANDLVIFPVLGIRVRLARGLGLEAAFCSCGAVDLCEHRLMAALAIVDDVPEVHRQPLAELEHTCELLWPRLVELLHLGLDSLPVEVAGDLHTLSRQIKTTLPAASDDLRALASLIEANARRSARFSPGAWLQATARLAARLMALEAVLRGEVAPGRRLHVVGRNRRDYIEAATLRVWGLGAEGFQGQGFQGQGFQGQQSTLLRLWFLQPETGAFFHVNVGRSGSQSHSPAFLWKSPVLWSQVPSELCGHPVQLLHPRLSPDGALAASEKTSARILPRASFGLDGLEPAVVATSAEALIGRWRKQIPPLLRPFEASTLATIVACDPEAPLAAPPVFDTHSQTLLVPLQLAQGGVLTLEAPHRPGDDGLLEALSQIERWSSSPTHWFVRFRPTSRGLRATPVAVWFDGEARPYSPGFSDIPLRPGPSIKPPSIHGLAPVTDPVDAALDQLLCVLESGVCQGLGRRSPHLERRLADAAIVLDRLGLPAGARRLEALVATPDPDQAARHIGALVAWAMSLREAWYL